MGELSGKVAVVTGGASGIGRATAELFASEGASVVIADLDAARGEALAGAIGPAALFRRTDVADAGQMQALVDAAVDRFGGLDVMVNNAGMPSAAHADFLDDPLDDFDRVLSVNLYGVMVGTQRAARHMAARGGGAIVNTSSIAGSVRGLAVMTYRASKAAVIHFTHCAAIDLAQYGIRVNCLVPGHVRTAITDGMFGTMTPDEAARVDAATRPVWDANKPLKRAGTPEDVARATLFLASERSAYITGVSLPVDAGVSIGDPVNHLRQLREAQAGAMAAGAA